MVGPGVVNDASELFVAFCGEDGLAGRMALGTGGVRGNLRDFASGAQLKKLCGTRDRSIALAGRAAPYR